MAAIVRGWNELAEYQWAIDYGTVAIAVGLWVLASIGAGLCWLVVTRAFGIRLPVLPAMRVYSTSTLGKYLPGKVIHVFARVYLVQQQGVPVTVGTTSTMLDVLLYTAAGLVLAVFALPFALPPELSSAQPFILVLAGMAVLLGFGMLHPRVLNSVLAVGGRFIPRLRGLRIDIRYSAILFVFLLYMALWLLITAAVYTGVRSVTMLPPTYAPVLGAVFAFSYVVGLFIPTPAGLGGREAAMAGLFSSFMPFPAAVVATVLNRLLQVSAEAMCAGLLSLLARRRI